MNPCQAFVLYIRTISVRTCSFCNRTYFDLSFFIQQIWTCKILVALCCDNYSYECNRHFEYIYMYNFVFLNTSRMITKQLLYELLYFKVVCLLVLFYILHTSPIHMLSTCQNNRQIYISIFCSTSSIINFKRTLAKEVLLRNQKASLSSMEFANCIAKRCRFAGDVKKIYYTRK